MKVLLLLAMLGIVAVSGCLNQTQSTQEPTKTAQPNVQNTAQNATSITTEESATSAVENVSKNLADVNAGLKDLEGILP